MKTREPGRTGIRISPHRPGSTVFGAGINSLDTADVVLATGGTGPMSADPTWRGSSRSWIITAVEDSLRRHPAVERAVA
ncbi:MULTISPECIES: hypothetical protein [Actinosynnema]|uniref:hypothetical protein n=1 Tax=Actinosynnema TaxID=40566 RepID=UPI0020A5A6BC|nr:hypothetical protein [Actinosynnema pretiosum]MCP2096223.1 hypothetical protein [Actinosynnema pretiosum]